MRVRGKSKNLESSMQVSFKSPSFPGPSSRSQFATNSVWFRLFGQRDDVLSVSIDDRDSRRLRSPYNETDGARREERGTATMGLLPTVALNCLFPISLVAQTPGALQHGKLF